ncbi:MAG: DUF2304 domain-containing protein [Candidatus Omnitrophica bacterium]|nr:DUF2304 domain-containing protein [Candidatus Omnitrophota bacterium]
MHPKIFTILLAAVIFMIVIDAIRRQKMTFKYSIFWMSNCLLALVLSINDRILVRLSELAGFSLPSNFIFFLLLVFFIVLSFLLTIYVNEQNTRTENLAQAMALLEHKFDQSLNQKTDSTKK